MQKEARIVRGTLDAVSTSIAGAFSEEGLKFLQGFRNSLDNLARGDDAPKPGTAGYTEQAPVPTSEAVAPDAFLSLF